VLQAAQRQLAHEMSKNKVTSLLKSRPAPEDLPDSILPGTNLNITFKNTCNIYCMVVTGGSVCSCRGHVRSSKGSAEMLECSNDNNSYAQHYHYQYIVLTAVQQVDVIIYMYMYTCAFTTLIQTGRSAHVADSLQGPRQTLEFNISKDAVSSRLKRRPSIEEVKDQGIIIGTFHAAYCVVVSSHALSFAAQYCKMPFSD
jgi:hypothetical protein